MPSSPQRKARDRAWSWVKSGAFVSGVVDIEAVKATYDSRHLRRVSRRVSSVQLEMPETSGT